MSRTKQSGTQECSEGELDADPLHMGLRCGRRDFLRVLAGAATGLVLRRVAASPAAAALGFLTSPTQHAGVPVFMYHTTDFQGLTLEEFRVQMRVLHELGFRTITLRTLREYLRNNGTVPRGRVVLTFDDIANWSSGQGKNYMEEPFGDFWKNVFPELRRYGFTAVLGVVTDLMPEEREGWDWKKLRFLNGLGYELASHSVTHTYRMIGVGGTLSEEQFNAEFAMSQKVIGQKCGIEPVTYIWPFGEVKYRERAEKLYPILVNEVEEGPVRQLSQLQHVPRYHPDLHMGENFRTLMLPFREPGAVRTKPR